MGSKWRKLKLALGLNLFSYVPKTAVNEDESSLPPLERLSDAALLSPAPDWSSVHGSAPSTPNALGLKLSKSLSRSSKKICSICLASMRRGDGQAIFTAECSHSFHFKCIASNVKHGNQVCPVCRAKWKEIPFQAPKLDHPPGRARVNPVDWSQNNGTMTIIRRLPPRLNSNRYITPPCQAPEPAFFNDDESLDHIHQADVRRLNDNIADVDELRTVRIKTYTEVLELQRSDSCDEFNVLVHLKAPASNLSRDLTRTHGNVPSISHTPRTPVDLVTVLDISGSMAGTKLALLKRAMGFLIQNMGASDRLAVIAFSSTARRLFPLRRMSESGRQEALQAVNSLVANGGTNIAEGLRKAAKVMEDRRERNPVGSIILLSDGQDTYTVNSNGNQHPPNFNVLLPSSIHDENSSSFKIPVHAFGFGADHDASSMHSISEISGGTFSFIETEGVIQDAFAQCIGGLLSVVVKDLHLHIECLHPKVHLVSLKAGSYRNQVMPDRRAGFIDVGDLYADEERDFLVSVDVPKEVISNETSLLSVSCNYKDPLTEDIVTLGDAEVNIGRPEVVTQQTVSLEVDRQKNRIQAAQAIAEARTAAENVDLAGAVSILDNYRKILSESVSAMSGDRLCLSLDAELKEMQERMTSRHVYEASGRAYILSGLSSHSWQRATARGDSIDGSTPLHAYQTPSMVEMLSRSQAFQLGSPSTRRGG